LQSDPDRRTKSVAASVEIDQNARLRHAEIHQRHVTLAAR
jgi:hypothetical protein